jgi:hypothetical protein
MPRILVWAARLGRAAHHEMLESMQEIIRMFIVLARAIMIVHASLPRSSAVKSVNKPGG